jgi:hypothetical protein
MTGARTSLVEDTAVFWDVVCEDTALLRAQFDELIAACWEDSPPPPPSRRVGSRRLPPREPHYRLGGEPRRPSPNGTTEPTVVSRQGRQRGPPTC